MDKSIIEFIKQFFSKLSPLTEKDSKKFLLLIVFLIALIAFFDCDIPSKCFKYYKEYKEITSKPIIIEKKISTNILIRDDINNKIIDSVQIAIPNLDSVVWLYNNHNTITIKSNKDTFFSISIRKAGYIPDNNLVLKFTKNNSESTFLMKKQNKLSL